MFLLACNQIHNRDDEAVEERRGEQAAEDDLGHRGLDLVAGEVAAECQREQGEGGGHRGHQDRVEAVERAGRHGLDGGEPPGRQGVVAVDEEHAVAGRDAEEGDEADDRGDAQDAADGVEGDHAADQGEGQVEEHNEALACILECAIQEHEDDQEAEEADEGDGPRGAFLALELAAELDAVAFGEGDVRGDLFADRGDGAGEFAAGRVAGDDELAAEVLAVDGVRAGGGDDVSDIAQGDFLPVRRVQHQVRDGFHRPARLVLHLECQVEGAVALVDRGDGLAFEGHADELREFGQGDSVAGQHLPPGDDVELRPLDLLLDVDVGDALDFGDGRLDLLTDGVHPVQVRTEDLDRDVRLGAGEHRVDAVGDRAADLEVDAGQDGELLPDFVGQLPAGFPLREDEGTFELGAVDAESVLVKLGAAGLAADGEDLGDAHQDLFGLTSEPVGLLQGDAGDRAHCNRKGAFVEGGQEAAAEGEEHRERDRQQAVEDAEDRFPVAQGPAERDRVAFLQPGRHGGLLLLRRVAGLRVRFMGEEVGAEDRRDRQGDEGRGAEGDDEGDAEGLQHPPFHPGEEEEGQEAGDDDEGRVEHRHPDLLRGLVDGLQDALSPGLPEALEDVLDVDDRVVDEGADRDGDAAEAHRIDGQAQEAEGEEGDDDGEGDRDQRDQGRAPVHQEDEEDEDDEDAAFEEGFLHVADRAVDEARLAEDLRVDLHVGGEFGADFVERLLEPFRQREAAGPRLLRHGQDHGRLPVVRGEAEDGGLRAGPDVGDRLERNRRTGRGGLHDRFLELFDVIGGEEPPDDVFVAVLVEGAARGVLVHSLHGVNDLVQRDAEVAHPGRVHQDLVLLDVAAGHGHLGHAARREQPGADRPVRQRAEVLHRGRVGGQADDHQLPEDRGLGTEGRAPGVRRKRIPDHRDLLADDLARLVDIGAPVEFYVHDREARARAGADAADIGRAVDRGFDREGDQPFDFLRGHPFAFGHHDDRRRVEVREDVDFGMHRGIDSRDQAERGDHEDRHAVVEGEADDSVQESVLMPDLFHTTNGCGYVRQARRSRRPASREPLLP